MPAEATGGGGGNVASAVVSGAIASGQQREANAQNRAEARRNREFQERMSNTAYQRSVKDMRLAGINPMLAAKAGGASSPAGAQANMQSGAKDAISAAVAASQLKANLRLTNAQAELTSANAVGSQQNNRIRGVVPAAMEAMNLTKAVKWAGKGVTNFGSYLGDTAANAKEVIDKNIPYYDFTGPKWNPPKKANK